MIRESAPLRILVVTNLYPSPASPAFGTFVGGRVTTVRAQGHAVAVAAIRDDRAHVAVRRKYLRLAVDAVGTAILARVRRRPFDIVEAHIAFPTGLLAWLAARIGGGRLVLFAHGSDVTRLPWGSAMRARLARWVFGQADLVVANSAFLAAQTVARLGPLRRPVLVASPGVEIPPSPATVTRDLDQIVFIGRLVPGKGVDLLVPAMRRLSADVARARLTVIGDGPLRGELEAAIASAGLADRIALAGWLAPSAVAAVLDRSAVVTVPSDAPEGLGLVALEGMAHGAIVVGTTQGGLAEIMHDGRDGVVVESGDAAALAAGLAEGLRLASGPDGDRLRAVGRATAAGHERGAQVAMTIEAYRRILT